MALTKLWAILTAQQRRWQQQREIDQLHRELAQLRAQNDSMRDGMRRCVTCDYRIDFKQRQDVAAQDGVAQGRVAPVRSAQDGNLSADMQPGSDA